MKVMDISDLKKEAKIFCELMKKENHSSLIGVTDGKAVGTYVEHRFQDYISSKYEIEIGSSARGIDLPGAEIETDIKVTSIVQPQSSCPFMIRKIQQLHVLWISSIVHLLISLEPLIILLQND